MTGFGRGEAPLRGAEASAEVRTVNSRHLDLRIRLPRDLGALEAGLRAALPRHFARGQVDLIVRLPPDLEIAAEVRVNTALARRYLEAALRLQRELGLQGDLSLRDLLERPGVVEPGEPALEPEEASRAVLAAVEQACAEASEMRAREGAALAADLGERVRRLEKALGEIDARAEEVKRGVRERLARRLAALAPEVELDPGRLEQEVVYYADRMDVTEETVRLRSHLEQFREALERGGPVGRKLEFLVQEMAREANTLGAKAGDAPLGAQVVEIKTELEKIREQAMNVE